MSPKKINPSQDTCNAHKLNEQRFQKVIQKGVNVERFCYSCFYSLFAMCWLREAGAGHDLVLKALYGNEEAKRKLHANIGKE